MSELKTFAERLSDARNTLGISASEAARRMGISAQTFRNWELGATFPQNVEVRKKLAVVMGVTETWLYSGLGVKSAEEQEKITMQAQEERKAKTEVVYRACDKRQLEDIELIIHHIRELGITDDEKRAVHMTLSEIRLDLEGKVLFGVRR